MINVASQIVRLHTESPRSDKWPHVRLAHLAEQPYCKHCGGTADLEVHHIQPFHLHPELELEPTNLITLCEHTPTECHLFIGHLGNWKSVNPNVLVQATFTPLANAHS